MTRPILPPGPRHGPAARAAAAGALLLALAGCGSGVDGPRVASLGAATTGPAASGSAGPVDAADRETAMRKFAQCMRTNGVEDFPDPTVDADGNVRLEGLGTVQGDPSVQQALTACRSLRAGIRPNFTPEEQQERQDSILRYARCMRENGYPMADPDFSGDGRPLDGIRLDDPAFVEADAICRPETLGQLPRRGGTPSPAAG